MEKTIAKTKVYNVIIMDRSGSMWDIQKPAIMGFNEVLGGVKAAAQKYAETQEQLMTLVLFDSTSDPDRRNLCSRFQHAAVRRDGPDAYQA